MKKILIIGWKDLIITFRDRAALIMMLAAPLVLTVGLGFVTGSFSGSDDNNGIQDIPIVVVNEDEGQLGEALVTALNSPELAELLEPAMSADPAQAKALVDNDEIAAVVLIPVGFTGSIIPDQQSGQATEAVSIEVYSSPARPISSSVVQAIVTDFVNRINTNVLSGEVAINQLITSGLIDDQAVPEVARRLSAQLQADPQGGTDVIAINRTTTGPDSEQGFNPIAFFSTGMAVFFLMYTVTIGGRSILAERNEGTLGRLLVTPTTIVQVLGGKVLGIFMSGFAQVGLLILGTTLLFNLNWGDPLGIVVLVAAVSAAATGWGLLLAGFAKTTAHVGSIGTALMLTFGILGGSFIPAENFTGPLRSLRLITPNAWAMDGFNLLNTGRTLADIGGQVGGLVVMAAVLFAVAVFMFRRKWASMV
ncbi:MAG: ABC transporter permease [Candidatus Promineifilaceae bacterium]